MKGPKKGFKNFAIFLTNQTFYNFPLYIVTKTLWFVCILYFGHNIFESCLSLSLFSLCLVKLMNNILKHLITKGISKMDIIISLLLLKGKWTFCLGELINLMAKGIHLNRDTKDLIMLVMDEQKKVVNFLKNL